MVFRLIPRSPERDAWAGAVPQPEKDEGTHQHPDEKRDGPRLHGRSLSEPQL